MHAKGCTLRQARLILTWQNVYVCMLVCIYKYTPALCHCMHMYMSYVFSCQPARTCVYTYIYIHIIYIYIIILPRNVSKCSAVTEYDTTCICMHSKSSFINIYMCLWTCGCLQYAQAKTHTHAHMHTPRAPPSFLLVHGWMLDLDLDVRSGCWMLDEDLSIQLYVVSQLAGK